MPVSMPLMSEPAFGSVIARQILFFPLRISGIILLIFDKCSTRNKGERGRERERENKGS